MLKASPQRKLQVMASLRGALQDVRDFCERTGLHGYAYVFSGRNRVETVFWCITCLVALGWTGQICYEAMVYWRENPVQTT